MVLHWPDGDPLNLFGRDRPESNESKVFDCRLVKKDPGVSDEVDVVLACEEAVPNPDKERRKPVLSGVQIALAHDGTGAGGSTFERVPA